MDTGPTHALKDLLAEAPPRPPAGRKPVSGPDQAGSPGPRVGGPEGSLDELFSATRTYRKSSEFRRLLRFMRRFPQYSPYNCFLLHVQNPEAKLVATAGQWRSRFGREVSPGARPMVILARMSPVLFVFDLEDTEGDPLPAELENPFVVHGVLPVRVWEKTITNCHRLGIEVGKRHFSRLKAGEVSLKDPPEEDPLQNQRPPGEFEVGVNKRLSLESQYAILVHELAHVWCGHLGPPPGKPSLNRRNLETSLREFEAEAVAYLVCKRRGLRTTSAKYLAGHMRRDTELPPISLQTVLWASHKIEEMGTRFPPREKSRP